MQRLNNYKNGRNYTNIFKVKKLYQSDYFISRK